MSLVGDKAKSIKVDGLEEISGHGIKGTIDGKEVLVGNLKLMDKMGIKVNEGIKSIADRIVVVAVDKKLAGYVTIADQIKEDSKDAIKHYTQGAFSERLTYTSAVIQKPPFCFNAL